MLVRTRMAPSPTGELHIGSMYVALKNYAYAKKHHGQFIIRIEDTDRERLVPGAIERILSAFRHYGLTWDEGPDIGGPYAPYIQSERLPLYQQYAQSLVEKGKAYYCFCTKERLTAMREAQQQAGKLPKYDRHCLSLDQATIKQNLKSGLPYVIRLKVPDHETITFTDLIRGPISFNTDLLDDQVLLKSDGFPTYHLGVVVDDYLMKITHIIRGDEWISSTPKHILLYHAFGWPLPIFAHAPDLLSPTGKGKMSKRQGDVSAEHFLAIGYLPEALLNFLMILGWSTSDQEEILDIDRYIQEFDIQDINKKPVAFDLGKLDYLNGVYIRRLSDQALATKLLPYKPAALSDELFHKFIPLIKDRLVKLSDFSDQSSYLCSAPVVNPQALLKLSKMPPTDLVAYLKAVIQTLSTLDAWTVAKIESVLRELQEKLSLKPHPAFMSLRLSLTGTEATPPLFDIIELLGKDVVIARLKSVINLISNI